MAFTALPLQIPAEVDRLQLCSDLAVTQSQGSRVQEELHTGCRANAASFISVLFDLGASIHQYGRLNNRPRQIQALSDEHCGVHNGLH